MWRRSGESLMVGENLEIEILESRPNRVKLGITAPDSVSVIRKETRLTRESNMTSAWSVDANVIQSLAKNLSR